jgi:hypothetical protein
MKGGLEMDKILNRVRYLLARLFEPAAPARPVCDMAPRDWADLPTHHPRRESDGC